MCIGVKVRPPATGSSDSCELPYGCWELNPGPLEEQSVLLTTEPSLQPHFFFFLRQGFSVALEPVLELTSIDQVSLELTNIHLCLPL